MAQKVDLKKVEKLKPRIQFEDIVQTIPAEYSGIKPYIEEPERVVKKAVRNSLLILALVLVIAGGLLYFFVKAIVKNSQELQGKQNLIYLARKQNQDGSELIREWNEISTNKEKITSSMPSSNDLLGYLSALDSVAEASGVKQTVRLQTSTPPSASIAATKNAVKISGVEHTIELEGSFDQLTNYLAGLEKLPYFTKILSINISAQQDLNDNASASLKIKVFTME